ncbi:hypothetical protein YQ44_18705 [Janthinobacterium sp. 1_2014MBL_MicDiv]|nr:hypothetical protein YQ44_18705 [Janthinobacterium sp. 1_2014MBL_MicDiv]
MLTAFKRSCTFMQTVYTLTDALAKDPTRIAKTQALTLDPGKPRFGLKGSHGLFASDAWWESIRTGRIQTQTVTGIIERSYFAGQDSRRGDEVNSITLRLDDGSTVEESIYTNHKRDSKLFIAGATVAIRYVLDELKAQPAADGGIHYARTVLDVAISGSRGRE